MSSNSDRGILIDDDDPSIRYNGPWALLETSAGILNTVHELIEPSGVMGLSVDFTGVSVIAYAITRHGNDSTGAPVPHPVLYTVNCLIDGSSVSNMSVAEASTFETAVCNSTEILTAGTTHTLQIILDFPSPSPNFGFYLDYLIVTPAQNQTIGAQENAFFYAGDPVIQTTIQQANAGWINQGTWYETSVQGSQFTLQFTGVAISWYGKKSTNPRLANSTATYTIDDSDPFPFQLVYYPELAAQPGLFKTQQYPYGNHTLRVVHNGNTGSIPLTLIALIVQRVAATDNAAGVPQTGTISTSTDTTLPALSTSVQVPVSSSPSTSMQPHQRGVDGAKIGGIVGGVIGVVIVVIVVAYLLVFRRRRIRDRPTSVSLAPSVYFNHEELVPDPYPFPASGPPGSREPIKTSATVSTQYTPFAYDMEEVHETGIVARTPSQYPSSTQASPARTDYGDNLGVNSDGARYNLREEDSGIRVMKPGSSLPPLYTAN
jgi:hypothetical protein